MAIQHDRGVYTPGQTIGTYVAAFRIREALLRATADGAVDAGVMVSFFFFFWIIFKWCEGM